MEFRRNHYVPAWYQKRFLRNIKQQELHLLDMETPPILGNDGRARNGHSVRRKSTDHCFFEMDLYTTFFPNAYSTDIEQKFFGVIDRRAPQLLDALEGFQHPLSINPQLLVDALKILSIQKLRTPKGLRELSQNLHSSDKNHLLYEMQRLRNLYCAIWTEGIWQVADASLSNTKFIVSDHPVTTYNRACYPGSADCGKSNDPDIRYYGTHTLFPISSEKILIITNTAYVRDPFGKPTRMRPNPTMLRPAVFNATEIQTERHLDEQEVITINYILKKRAFRFIAASEREWLYPERHLPRESWFNLGGGDILMPDPRGVSFTGNIYIGYENDLSEAYDTYGFRPWQKGYSDERRANEEWTTFEAAKAVFAKKFGPKRRGRAGDGSSIDPEVDSDELHQIHLKGLEKLKKVKIWQKK